MKVVVWNVLLFEVVCGQGYLYGIHMGRKMFCGLGLQVQPDGSSVRNIFEGSLTEEVTGEGKDIFE